VVGVDVHLHQAEAGLGDRIVLVVAVDHGSVGGLAVGAAQADAVGRTQVGDAPVDVPVEVQDGVHAQGVGHGRELGAGAGLLDQLELVAQAAQDVVEVVGRGDGPGVDGARGGVHREAHGVVAADDGQGALVAGHDAHALHAAQALAEEGFPSAEVEDAEGDLDDLGTRVVVVRVLGIHGFAPSVDGWWNLRIQLAE